MDVAVYVVLVAGWHGRLDAWLDETSLEPCRRAGRGCACALRLFDVGGVRWSLRWRREQTREG